MNEYCSLLQSQVGRQQSYIPDVPGIVEFCGRLLETTEEELTEKICIREVATGGVERVLRQELRTQHRLLKIWKMKKMMVFFQKVQILSRGSRRIGEGCSS